jgi:hypothetical protein
MAVEVFTAFRLSGSGKEILLFDNFQLEVFIVTFSPAPCALSLLPLILTADRR